MNSILHLSLAYHAVLCQCWSLFECQLDIYIFLKSKQWSDMANSKCYLPPPSQASPVLNLHLHHYWISSQSKYFLTILNYPFTLLTHIYTQIPLILLGKYLWIWFLFSTLTALTYKNLSLAYKTAITAFFPKPQPHLSFHQSTFQLLLELTF